jgi:translation initiation factor IF-1
MVNVVTDVFKSFEVEGKNGTIRIDEGDKIKFCTEAGVDKRGVVTKIQGKGEKAKIQILPEGKECEEVWSVMVMAENSLALDNGTEEDYE